MCWKTRMINTKNDITHKAIKTSIAKSFYITGESLFFKIERKKTAGRPERHISTVIKDNELSIINSRTKKNISRKYQILKNGV